MFILDGKTLPLDTPFTHNDIQYPANWLRLTTLEEKEAIGITEQPDPEQYDDRFYWGPNNPKQLEDINTFQEGSDVSVVESKGLKSQWVAQIKQIAGSLLAQTDWMIIRKMERNVDIPEAVSTYRAAVVAEATRLETDILAVADVESLITVISTQNWPKTT